MTQGLWTTKDINALHLEITNRCNAGCPMCPRYINNGAELNPLLRETEITIDQFKDWFNVDFVKQLDRVYACGNYGDPIAAKDTLKIMQYLRENGKPSLGLGMHTNGSARSPAWFAELGKLMTADQQSNFCIFSVDGLGDTNHLYRKNTNFDKIYNNMKAFIDAGGVAKWDYIVFRHNEHQVEQARSIAKDLGFKEFNVKRTTRWNDHDEQGRGFFEVRSKQNTIEYKLEQPDDETLRDDNSKAMKKVIGIVPNYITNAEFDRMRIPNMDYTVRTYDSETKQFIRVDHRKIEVSCRAVANHRGGNGYNDELFISAEGEVYPCCFLGGEFNRYSEATDVDTFIKMVRLTGGRDAISLYNNSLDTIINSDLYQQLLPRSFATGHNMRSKQCSTCCGKEWNKLDNGEIGNKDNAAL